MHSIRSLALVILSVTLFTLAGCAGAKDRISHAAAVVTQQANLTRSQLSAAIATGDVGDEALPLVESAIANQDKIITAAAGIVDELPNVRDVVPLWRRVLYWIVPLAGVGLVVALLVWSNLWSLAIELVRLLVGRFAAVLRRVFHPEAPYHATELLKAKRQGVVL